MAFWVFLGMLVWSDVALSFDLEVQTFNAYGPLYARHLAKRTNGVIQEISASPSHIYGFQEVWDIDHGLRLQKGLRSLHPDLHVIDFDRRHWGRTGLRTFVSGELHYFRSRDYPVNHDGMVDWVRGRLGVVKTLGMARVTFPKLGTLLVINTHTHPLSAKIRLSQMVYLVEQVYRVLPQVDHVIVMGDFNFTYRSFEYEFLVQALELTDSYRSLHGDYKKVCTYCRKNPYYWGGGDRVIDFIFSRSLGARKLVPKESVINLQKSESLVLSDHYGIKTRFLLTEGVESQVAAQPSDEILLSKAIHLLSSNPLKFAKPLKVLHRWLKSAAHPPAFLPAKEPSPEPSG